jgi:hypothetical protein
MKKGTGHHMENETDIQELDLLRAAYKTAVEEWIKAIRAEENLATPDHTVPAVDVWEHAGFDEEDARDKAKEARQAYEDALRKVDFNF